MKKDTQVGLMKVLDFIFYKGFNYLLWGVVVVCLAVAGYYYFLASIGK